MNDARVDARSLKRAHALDETVDLDLEIERFSSIGGCEMREAPLQIERPMEADLRDELDHLIVTHTNAIHASVDGQVKRCFQVVRVGDLGVVDREVGRVDRRDDAIVQQQRHAFDGRLRQKQNRFAEIRFAQLDALVHRCHAQIRCASSRCDLRHLVGSMPIGIGLHHCQKAATLPEQSARFGDVVLDGAAAYLDPRPTAILLGNARERFLAEALVLGIFLRFDVARVLIATITILE